MIKKRGPMSAQNLLETASSAARTRREANERRRFFRVLFSRRLVAFGASVIVVVVMLAIFAPLVAPYDPNEQDLTNTLKGPSGAHWLGTDGNGRDTLSRIIYGSRIALEIGVGTVVIAAALGTLIGLIAGYLGGKVFAVLMRLTDALMAIPPIMLALILAAVLGGGIQGVMIGVSVSLLPGYIRIICGQVLSVKENDYVLSARSIGSTPARIMFRHVLPNCVSPLIVQMTLMMGLAIIIEASLSFLGMGIKPPTAAWGAMVYEGYKYLTTLPIIALAPGVAVMLLVFSFNMLGDGLNDALDPRLRGTL